MTEPELHYVQCPDAHGMHRMAYWQWGDPQGQALTVCVHGLSRQGRDFDVLAQALVAQYGTGARVVCPDVVGRGHSDWLKDPMAYQISTYVADMACLLQQLHQQKPIACLDWVGTSMGGLIGMALCGTPNLALPVPVRRLVLNDVGPVIQWQSLERIAAYLGKTMRFDSLEQAADALWAISSGFGPHTRQQWLALTRPMLKPHPAGGLLLHYDPAIAQPVRSLTREAAQQGEAVLWQLYDHITAETLLLRGAQSDLLAAETAQQMTRRGPKARCVEIAGVGHAPTLVQDDQVACVLSFLQPTIHASERLPKPQPTDHTQ